MAVKRGAAGKQPPPDPMPVGYRDIPKAADQVMPYPVGGWMGLPRYQEV
jgi:hypothetical protein